MSETELCRICANEADQINSEKLFEQNQRQLLRQIEELIGQRLKNAKDLPQHICNSCEENTLQAHAFRESCIRAQEYFALRKTERKQHKKRKLKEIVPPIEEVVLNELKPFKEEKEDDAVLLPKITEIMVKYEPPNSEDSDDGFNPIDENQNITDEEDMATIEPEISLFADERPLLKKTESKQHKKHKSAMITKSKKSYQKPKEKKFICDQCGRHFASNSDLESHIRRHTGEKLFKCEICPESFFLKVGLKRHILKHSGELPYPCSQCERRFLDKCHATKHERTHTNERPYICQQCGKGFTVSHILKSHMLVHTGERAFGCKLCNAAFKLKKHLVTHYRSMTHKQNMEKQQMSTIKFPIGTQEHTSENFFVTSTISN